jgi:hypothetical protein
LPGQKVTEIIKEKNKLSNREFICMFYNFSLTSTWIIEDKKGELVRIISENSMGNILVVSHVYATKCLIMAALDLPVEGYANKINFKNTSISIVELKGREIPGRLLVLNNK